MAILARSEDFKTPLLRAAFVNGLFETRKPSETSDRREWQCSLLFPKPEIPAILNEMMATTAEAAWPGKARSMVELGTLKSPILDGDGPQGVNKKKGERLEGFAGHNFIRVSSGEKFRPKLIDRNMLPIVDRSGPLFSGSYVYGVLHCLAWNNDKGGCGLSFGVTMIQAVKGNRDTDLLGGDGTFDADPEKFFEKIPGGDTAASAATRTGAGAGGLFG